MNETNFTEAYTSEYDKLNDLQKKAVDTILGPVMVIAGPGTGKTQILSRRVANILLNYKTDPKEIVCLTYTEAGASEMLDRLEKLLGERGRDVRVSTIHAFCSALILAHPEQFENRPKVISTAVQYELLKEIMDEHLQEGDSLYKHSGDRYSSKDQLFELLSRLKKEKLDKEKIKYEVDEYLKMIELSAPGDDLYAKFKYKRKYRDKQAGDLKPAFEKEQKKYDNVLNGAGIIEKYRKRLSEYNYFDFDDMILWTKDMIEKNPELQKEVAESISYLFIDEFQDTSVIQNELVDLLVKGKDNPNIFVVGDDDQSIYRFQGVSESNIEDFDQKYKPTEIILEENYRSSQIIIDAAKAVITKNKNRRVKQLRAAGNNKYYEQKIPTLTEYPTESDEQIGVLREVQKLLKDGVTPKEIGIIYGRNAYGQKLAKLFKENGVPVHIKNDDNLFEDSFFKKLYSLLQYLNRPNRNIKELRKLLYFDFFNISIDELVKLRDISSIEQITSSRVLALDKEMEKLRLKLSKSKQYISPMFVLQQMVKVFGIDAYIMQSKEKYHLVSVLTTLYDLMVNEVSINPGLTLSDFLYCIVGLREMKVEIPINELETSPDNCINLMTAHGSKGLEFDYVFMVKCNDGKKGAEWPGGENRNGRFSYPPSLSGKSENEVELKEQENRRLFYVAMTRAKKELHLSYHAKMKKTHFLDDLAEFYEEIVKENFEEAQTTDSVVDVPSLSEGVVKEVITDFSLSVSTLNSFLKCPLSFYFNKVLKWPAESNEAMTFGSIVHETLEAIYVSDQEDLHELTPKTILSKDECLKRFEAIFEREADKLPTVRARKDDYIRGVSIINNFYNADNYLKPGIVAVEKNIQGVKLGAIQQTTVDLSKVAGFTLNGKIDKIEVEDDLVRVIDYKTGSAKNGKKKLAGPSENAPEGEDYWRQAVFYYILLTNSDIDLSEKRVCVQYVFVEDDDNPNGFYETPEIEITEQDVDIVLGQIRDKLIQIQNGDFTHGCGIFEKYTNENKVNIYPCHYCAYANLNAGPLVDNSQAIEVASYKDTVKSFKSLSVSSLNRFLNCSNSFYFDNVLKLTTAAGLKPAVKKYANKVEMKHKPTGPVFGTVIHETMEAIYRDSLNLEEALVTFDKSLSIHETEIIDTMGTEEMKAYGHKLLDNLFESYIPGSCRNVELEKEIHVTLENNLPIIGIIDKLEFDGDIIRVVDYKTGSTQHGIEELEPGGNYWRQAVYYNILLEECNDISTTGKTIETRYIFLDDESQELGYSIHDVVVTAEDIDVVKGQIQCFWTSIRQGTFNRNCCDDSCDFCRLAEFVDSSSLIEKD